jgi:hypothetical protein
MPSTAVIRPPTTVKAIRGPAAQNLTQDSELARCYSGPTIRRDEETATCPVGATLEAAWRTVKDGGRSEL